MYLDLERTFCIYCKGTMNSYELKHGQNYHDLCYKIVRKYNRRLFTRLHKIKLFKINKNQKFNWTTNKNFLYRIIFSLGGINILFILIYELVIGIV